eukprot:12254879-Alexandrium_andersonii.AAC.1
MSRLPWPREKRQNGSAGRGSLPRPQQARVRTTDLRTKFNHAFWDNLSARRYPMTRSPSTDRTERRIEPIEP